MANQIAEQKRPQIRIERATAADIPGIMDIAKANTLVEGDKPASFLVSNFTDKQYRAFLANSKHVSFLVAKDEADALAGFLIGYDEGYARTLPEYTSEQVIDRAIGDVARYRVIKQVAVAPNKQGGGVARSLYHEFCDLDDSGLVFAAIVEKPVPNTGSRDFHKALGFIQVLQSSPRNPHYGARLVNSIWLLTTRPRIYVPAAPSDADEFDGLSTALTHVNELYRHEDQLNWTKVSMLLTVLFALLTASWFLLTTEPRILTACGGVALILLGFTTLAAIREKIKSGLAFMKAYKASIRLLESRCSLNLPGFIPSVWRVPKTSRTYDWLRRLPGIALGLWSFTSALLLAHLVISLPLILSDLREILGS